MVSAQEKKSMKDFVLARLEDSLRYNILSANEYRIRLIGKQEFVKNPTEIYLALHNELMTKKFYNKLSEQQSLNGKCFASIFYMDNKTFMVRLAQSAIANADKSLKKYDDEQVSSFIHLRTLEKLVLEHQENDELSYYQPETTMIPESIRRYNMSAVILDHSYIPETNRKYNFVMNKPAVNYNLPEEILPEIQAGGIRFELVNKLKHIAKIVPR